MSAGLHEVDAERRAPVALDTIRASRNAWAKKHRRPASLTAREALAAVQFDALLIWTAIANIRAGTELNADDWERVTLAMQHIDSIVGEVNR